MKTLTIQDLAVTCELDRGSMAAVRGGYKMTSTSYSMPTMPANYSPASYSPTIDSSIHANQSLQQAQQVLNETADGSAFLSGVDVKNTTSQFGQNNVWVA